MTKYVTIMEEVEALICTGLGRDQIYEFCLEHGENVNVKEEKGRIFVEADNRTFPVDHNTVIVIGNDGRVRGISIKALNRGYRKK